MSTREIASAMARLGAESLAAHMLGDGVLTRRQGFAFARRAGYPARHGWRAPALRATRARTAQDRLVRSDPDHFFVPPYVGYRGWVGVILDTDPDWDQIARLVGDG